MKKLIILLACSVSPYVHADGLLDTTFGNGTGYMSTERILFPNGITQQPDGNIIVTGTSNSVAFKTMRFLPNGTLDATFGQQGIIISDAGVAFDVITDQFGRILVAGQDNDGNYQIARYDKFGNIDYSFGYNGSSSGPGGFFTCIAFQLDSKIICGGSNNDGDFLIIRYNDDGSVDTMFDLHIAGFIEDVKINLDNTIIAAGSDQDSNTQLARYNADGTIDNSFGNYGFVTGPQGPATCLAIQQDGKYVVAGYTLDMAPQMQVMRFNQNGTLDTTFGTDGIAELTAGLAYEIALQPDGKIIIVGQHENQGKVVRYNTDGAIDTTFGTDGSAMDVPGAFQSVTLQPDGRILTAGLNAGNNRLQLARYTGTEQIIACLTSPLTSPTGDITFQGTAPAPSQVHFFLDGMLIDSVNTIDDSTNWEVTTNVTLPGVYIATVIAHYHNGRINTAHTQPVRIYG